MERRQVLKNLGLGAGFLVASPSIMSLLQSCTSEPEFNPVFLSKGEGHALRRIVDLIIPSDDAVPGAADVGVHEFIDGFYNEVLPAEVQSMVRLGFGILANTFQSTNDKELEQGKPADFDALLAKYLKTSEEEQEGYQDKMDEFMAAYAEDPSSQPDADAAVFSLLSGIRDMTIWGWKSSEQIGENVLWYDPIPGIQKGCIPLSEAGNGNAAAL